MHMLPQLLASLQLMHRLTQLLASLQILEGIKQTVEKLRAEEDTNLKRIAECKTEQDALRKAAQNAAAL